MTTPQRLEAIRDLVQHGRTALVDGPLYFGDVLGEAVAAEIVRRYNLHDELVKALEDVVKRIELLDRRLGNGDMIMVNHLTMAHMREEARVGRAALARVRKEGTE